MAIRTSEHTHPVSGAVTAMRTLLAGLVDAPLYSMSPAEAARTLADLNRLAASVAELELRVAAHADVLEVGADAGATSTASWWAHHTHQDRGDASRRIALAHALGDGRSKVREALAAGDLTEEAAAIVVRALDALPEDLDPVTARRAEAVMVQHATELPPRQLRLAGKALLAVVAPTSPTPTRRSSSTPRNAAPGRRCGCPCSTTGTAPPTAPSPSPPCRPRC